MTGNPEASLQQVAAAVGISPGTVRTVRAEMLAAADGAGRRRQHESVQPDRPSFDRVSTLRDLRQDPSLRLTETGRAILRLLDFHAVLGGEQERFVDGVPGALSAVDRRTGPVERVRLAPIRGGSRPAA